MARGFETTILHGGQHESDLLPAEVPHIHADPHFEETLSGPLAGREFDVVVAQYGRLRTIARVLAGRTGHLVAVGSATGWTAPDEDPRWGPLGPPAVRTERNAVTPAPSRPGSATQEPASTKLRRRIAEAHEALFQSHREGDFKATYLGYPPLYGPYQPGPIDWALIRRVLDGRRKLIVADGALKIESRGYTKNVAEAVLLCIDRPDVSGGKTYIVADGAAQSMRQRIDYIARVLDHEFELVSLPFALAHPCYPLWRHLPGHIICDSSRIREELGYRDSTPAAEALRASVEWLVEHRPRPGDETERLIGDPFDYAAEDAVIEAAERGYAAVAAASPGPPRPAHQYRHPKRPDDSWEAHLEAEGRPPPS
jgi:nucleoside-diphosphate-sugar epimerase